MLSANFKQKRTAAASRGFPCDSTAFLYLCATYNLLPRIDSDVIEFIVSEALASDALLLMDTLRNVYQN